MKKKSILRNIIITLLALVAAGVISFIFQRLEVQEHITTIFVFSVLPKILHISPATNRCEVPCAPNRRIWYFSHIS